MEQATTIGLDIAKHVFQVHGADAAGHVLSRKRITRVKLLGFLAAQARRIVAMEACAGVHYWAREIAKLGHHVRLIAPAYVKPFIKRQKNDAADAEAICEAAQRHATETTPEAAEWGKHGRAPDAPRLDQGRAERGLPPLYAKSTEPGASAPGGIILPRQ
jgi:transposase